MTNSPRASRLTLPFLWGAGTSAHQVEGGNEANDWYHWETRADSVWVERSGTACDHLHRFAEDIALLAERVSTATASRSSGPGSSPSGGDARSGRSVTTAPCSRAAVSMD